MSEPTLYVSNVGDGETMRFEVSTGGTTRLYAGLEDLGGNTVLSFLGEVEGPAIVDYEGFTDGAWYHGVASNVDGVSPIIRFRPQDREPKFEINLYRQSIEEPSTAPGSNFCWRLRVESVAAIGMEAEIFVYERISETPVCDIFCGVATPLQMEELPKAGDDPNAKVFRKRIVDLVEDNYEEMEDNFDAVQADVKLLLEALERNRYLAQDAVITITGQSSTDIPIAPAPSSSSSSSSSVTP